MRKYRSTVWIHDIFSDKNKDTKNKDEKILNNMKNNKDLIILEKQPKKIFNLVGSSFRCPPAVYKNRIGAIDFFNEKFSNHIYYEYKIGTRCFSVKGLYED